MDRIAWFLLCGGMVACSQGGSDGGNAVDAALTPNDAPSESGVGCPKPIDYCGDAGSAICDQPAPEPIECAPLVDLYVWTECSNGDVIVSQAAENSGSSLYYRGGKLVARVAGDIVHSSCTEGPPAFERPECVETRHVDLCRGKDAGAE